MPFASLLAAFSVSKFDGRKLFVIMTILTVALIVESQIGYVADFIPEQLASQQGMVLFIVIWAVFTITQYYILAFVNYNNRKSKSKTRTVYYIHNAVTVVQYLLAAIIAFLILQILLTQQYNTIILNVVLSISFVLWIITLAILAKAFFSWYGLRREKNILVLILAVSMVVYVLNGALGLFFQIDLLMQQNPVIKYGDVAVFHEASISAELVDITNLLNAIASTIAYVLTWIGTVMLLRPYIKKFGKTKFWVIMSVAMVYYLITYPLEALGLLTYEDTETGIINIIIFGLAAVFTGIIFGAAFLSVARTLRLGGQVRNHMIIAAYGFVLFYIGGSALLSQAAYPPYGVVSIAVTGLSCYLIYNGLYLSAVTVSQDIALRKVIKKSAIEQSKLLHSIGTAEMERQVQNQVLSVAAKTSNTMAEETGVQASMNEDEMKDYVQAVMKELRGKKSEL